MRHTLDCPIAKNAFTHPQQPAIIAGKNTLTYQQLNSSIDAAIIQLKNAGVKANGRIAMISEPSLECVIALWALWRIKATACILNPRLPPQIIKKQIQKISARVISLNSLKDIQPAINLRNKIHQYSAKQASTIIFTSGTTSEPKAALHTMANHYYNARGSNQNITIRPKDAWLLSLPLYHVSGLGILWRTFLGGGTVVIPQGNEDIKTCLKKYALTHISLVPAQLIQLLQSKYDKHLKKLKCILLGGSAIPPALIHEARKKHLAVYLTFGLTEMASQVATSTKPFGPAQILPYRKLKIAPDGEIYVKGETLFKGYLQGKKLNSSRYNGWFKTGDLGKGKDGRHLKITGRKDNMFISAGENIQPEEIEKYLREIKGVEEAVVVPKHNQEFGLRPVAFIKAKRNMRLEIFNYLRGHLAKFKIPDELYLWPIELPRSGIKAQRKPLQQLIQKQSRKLKILT